MRLAIIALAALVAGCATPQVPVQVVANNFCLTAKKYSWSTEDSPATIEQIVRHNAGVDRACCVKATS